MFFQFIIEPVPKPRMTQRDKWAKRPAVMAYFQFKDQLVLQARSMSFELPDAFRVTFYLPMPASWSEKKRLKMDGTAHQSRPDLDNMLKALGDCLRDEDGSIYDVHAIKYWSRTGRIVVDTDC